jgi:hypothetical protein
MLLIQDWSGAFACDCGAACRSGGCGFESRPRRLEVCSRQLSVFAVSAVHFAEEMLRQETQSRRNLVVSKLKRWPNIPWNKLFITDTKSFALSLLAACDCDNFFEYLAAGFIYRLSVQNLTRI